MMKAHGLLVENRLEDTYWGKKIIAAEENGWFYTVDCHESGEWFSCACGQLDEHVDRNDSGVPLDAELENEGCDFSDYVNGPIWSTGDDGKLVSSFYLAAECLIRIEKRSIELLSEKKEWIA
jgi:hypothetical protein